MTPARPRTPSSPTSSGALPRPTRRRPGRTHPARRAVPGLLAALTALVVTLLAAPPASAHDVLVGSDPADGATVATPPTRITLTFEEAPQSQFATITVVGADGAHHEQGAAVVDGEQVTVPVRAGVPAGRYQIGWRVVSDDGHPVSGALGFTVPAGAAPSSAAPAATPVTPAAPSATPVANAASDGDDGGVPGWVFAVVAVVVVAAALAFVLRRRA